MTKPSSTKDVFLYILVVVLLDITLLESNWVMYEGS